MRDWRRRALVSLDSTRTDVEEAPFRCRRKLEGEEARPSLADLVLSGQAKTLEEELTRGDNEGEPFDLQHVIDGEGRTLPTLASILGHEACLAALIHAGADVNSTMSKVTTRVVAVGPHLPTPPLFLPVCTHQSRGCSCSSLTPSLNPDASS